MALTPDNHGSELMSNYNYTIFARWLNANTKCFSGNRSILLLPHVSKHIVPSSSNKQRKLKN